MSIPSTPSKWPNQATNPRPNVNWLASTRWRLFLVCWIVFTIHFATNIVREHYPAFSLIEDGDLYLDEYEGFHADIFPHTNGHAVIGNQVAGSLPAVPPLLLFDPVLDALQEWTLAQRDSGEAPVTEYRTALPNRQDFFAKVNERGLSLRFGASAFITSAFCMAPITAAFVVLLFNVLRWRGIAEGRATGFAFLFAFGTPVFYRAAHLVHNQFLMIVVFAGFLLLWRDGDEPLSRRRILGAGFLGGTCLALDYAGVIPLLVLYAYLGLPLWRQLGGDAKAFLAAFRESLWFVAASVPPVVFLWWTQYLMYGHPFFPGQMYQQENAYTGEGVRGMTLPNVEVFVRNLFDGSFGLVPFAPLLALAFVPRRWFLGRDADDAFIGRRERGYLWAFIWIFMLFCAMNRFSLLQFNTGFRYFMPIVPFLFLFVVDRVRAWPVRRLWAVAVVVIAHTWVLCMSRFTQPAPEYHDIPVVLANWREILTEGPKLPWMKILREVVPPDHWLQSPVWPVFVLVVGLGTAAAIWFGGARIAQRQSAIEAASRDAT